MGPRDRVVDGVGRASRSRLDVGEPLLHAKLTEVRKSAFPVAGPVDRSCGNSLNVGNGLPGLGRIMLKGTTTAHP